MKKLGLKVSKSSLLSVYTDPACPKILDLSGCGCATLRYRYQMPTKSLLLFRLILDIFHLLQNYQNLLITDSINRVQIQNIHQQPKENQQNTVHVVKITAEDRMYSWNNSLEFTHIYIYIYSFIYMNMYIYIYIYTDM